MPYIQLNEKQFSLRIGETNHQAAPTQAWWSRGRRLLSASSGALLPVGVFSFGAIRERVVGTTVAD